MPEPTEAEVNALEREQEEKKLQAEFDEYEKKERKRLELQEAYDKERKKIEEEKADVERKQKAEDKRKHDEVYKEPAPSKKIDKYTGNVTADRFINRVLDTGDSYLGNKSNAFSGFGARKVDIKDKKPKRGTSSSFSSGISLSAIDTPNIGRAQPSNTIRARVVSSGPQIGGSLGFPPIGSAVPKMGRQTMSVIPKSIIPRSSPRESFSLNMGSPFGKKKTNPVKRGRFSLFD